MGLEIPQTLQSTNISLFGRQPRSTYTKRAARSLFVSDINKQRLF
jgi:hypothetical protein